MPQRIQASLSSALSRSDLIAQKKFSIVYHTDNFLVRVHKFRENVYRLLALALGLDHSVTPKKFDSPREEQVVRACERRRLHSIARCITDFDHNPAVIAAIRERHLFVHQFREDLKRPELGAQNRARDFEDPVAAEVSALTDVPAIDRHADRRADELFRVLNAVRDFRNTLYDAIEDEIVAMIAKRSPETRRRLQSFVDFRKALRELAE